MCGYTGLYCEGKTRAEHLVMKCLLTRERSESLLDTQIRSYTAFFDFFFFVIRSL